ncbi:MAG: hypothetical protein JWM95_435 [Gemmatimonadetes bacterium]|nr:hypothetical protein [Gemmatimonadota bacterium]
MKRREPAPLIFSVAFHVLVAIAILRAAFHYDFSGEKPAVGNVPKAERVTYMRVAPPGGAAAGSDSSTAPARATRPARGLVTPIGIPPQLPAPAPSAGGTPGGAVGGKGSGGGVGVTTGIVPADPDPRLLSDSHVFYPEPKTHAERVDSALRATIVAYNDSIARMQGRKPGDWTIGKDGNKWGLDGNKIYLGKFAIPSAVLAALPIHIQGNRGELDADRLSGVRRADLLLHAESQLHDDEFKSTVKRIRERKDKERAEKMADPDRAPPSSPPIP